MILEILKFACSSLPNFIGSFILIATVTIGFSTAIAEFRLITFVSKG